MPTPAQFFHAYSIKNQWLNFSLYFTNFMYKTKNKVHRNKVCRRITSKYRLAGNENPIGGKQKNNIWLANGETTKTTFIEVNKEDFITFFNYKNTNQALPTNLRDIEQLGFRVKKSDVKGIYMRSENPTSNSATNITNQERDSQNQAVWNDSVSYYFLKGVNDNDIFKY